MEPSRIIKLDVGGTVFKTSRSTLTKYDCMFRAMLESEIPLETDESGCIFIDRDPTHFRYILNFLRDGNVRLPEDQVAVEQILAEAQFYLIQGLVDTCSKNQTFYRIIWDEQELQDVLKNASKDVLVLTWPARHLDSCSQSINNIIRELVKKYENIMEVFIKRDTDDKNWNFTIHSIKKDKTEYSQIVNEFCKDNMEFINRLNILFRSST